MRNKIENNPLFESLKDSARKYEKISENNPGATGSTGSTSTGAAPNKEKIKYAVEYARRIIETCYSEYIYFLNSIPDQGIKNDLITKTDELMKSQKTDPKGFKMFFELMVSKMEELAGKVTGSPAIRNLPNFDKIQEVYSKFEKAKNELSEVTFKEYVKEYANEYTSKEVNDAVKAFVEFSSQALEQSLKK